jgi:hypothetical protein
MADTIIDGTLFNVRDIQYGAPKSNPKGGKVVNVLNKNSKTGLRISTPLMLTWGASDFVDKDTGLPNGKFEMSLQFPSGEYADADTNAFLENIKNFEEKIKSDALLYSKEWFGKVHKSREVVDELFSPILKYPKNKETGETDLTRSPTIRIKVPKWDGIWKSVIYDEDEEKLFPSPVNPCISPLDFLKKGTHVACLIQCGGIWFTNGKFTVTWNLSQAVVQKSRAALSDECYVKLKPSDKEKLKAAAAVAEEDPVAPGGAMVEDSDDDADSESDVETHHTVFTPVPEPVPTPVPTPVLVPTTEVQKKKIIKKKITA